MIGGFQFQLCNVPIAKDESTVILYLVHMGHAMDILKDGSFINMDLMQTVALRDGVWEMIWRDESPGVLIICGLLSLRMRVVMVRYSKRDKLHDMAQKMALRSSRHARPTQR